MSSHHANARRSSLELVQGGRSRSAEAEERSYLLLEDLLDDPIELTLSDFGALSADRNEPPAGSFH